MLRLKRGGGKRKGRREQREGRNFSPVQPQIEEKVEGMKEWRKVSESHRGKRKEETSPSSEINKKRNIWGIRWGTSEPGTLKSARAHSDWGNTREKGGRGSDGLAGVQAAATKSLWCGRQAALLINEELRLLRGLKSGD